jgi:hypothetical protein
VRPLGPLPAKAVPEVTADRLDVEADARLLRLAGHSGGNPFLLVQVLDGLREEGLVRVEHGRRPALVPQAAVEVGVGGEPCVSFVVGWLSAEVGQQAHFRLGGPRSSFG